MLSLKHYNNPLYLDVILDREWHLDMSPHVELSKK